MTSNAALTAGPLELRAAEIEAAVARNETDFRILMCLFSRPDGVAHPSELRAYRPEPGQYDTCRRRPVRARSDHPGCRRAGSAPHDHTYQPRRRGTGAIATARYDGSYQGNFCRHAAAGVLPARR